MSRYSEDVDIETKLEEISRRLDRLERLVFIGYQETREVAEYAYQNLYVDPETAKRLSWTKSNFHELSDQEALEVGLVLPELAALKQTMRILRRQSRLDAVGIIRDLIRHARASTKLKEVA